MCLNAPSRSRKALRGAGGFTLIEILVVLVIITVFSSLMAFSLEGVRSRSIENEIERLRTVLEFASDYASVQGTPIAVDFLPDGYRFSAMQTDGSWRMLFTPSALSQQSWPESVSVTALEVEQLALKPPYRLVFGHEAPVFQLTLSTQEGPQLLTGGLLGTVERSRPQAGDS